MSRWRRGARLAALALSCAGCVSVSGRFVGAATSSCEAGRGDDCWLEGEMYLHRNSWTWYRDWSLDLDAGRARAAYQRGCQLHSLRACTALIELKLLDGDRARKTEVLAYITSVHGHIRTADELAEEDRALEELCRADNAHQEALASAEHERQMGLVFAAAMQATQNLSTTLATRRPDSTPVVASDDPRLLAMRDQARALKQQGRTAPASAPPGPARGKAKRAEVAAAPAAKPGSTPLTACLAEPLELMRADQTNPFPAHVSVFESLAEQAQGTCAPPRDWRECMDSQAMGALWSEEDRAQQHLDALEQRARKAVSWMPGGSSSCVFSKVHGTRAFCAIEGREPCLARLKEDAAELRCADGYLPSVWAGEDARDGEEARKKHDAACRARLH